MTSDKKSILISSKLFDIISNRIKNSIEFGSVDEYVDYVIAEILEIKKPESYTKEEYEKIEKHLKDMGYI